MELLFSLYLLLSFCQTVWTALLALLFMLGLAIAVTALVVVFVYVGYGLGLALGAFANWYHRPRVVKAKVGRNA